MRYTECDMISLKNLLYIVLGQNDHCALSKKNDSSTVGPPYPRLCTYGFNQLRMENIQEKKSRKFQKVKLEFATLWQLFI